jgi:hypothetical protein
MTWRDKLEIGLKEDAPFRKDNLPESQVRGPEISNGPGRSPEIPLARGDHSTVTNSMAATLPAGSDRRRPVTRPDADTGCRRRLSDLDG